VPKIRRIDSFDLEPGRILARKYQVLEKLGGGWEGEVYKIEERRTGIARAAKLFFPQRNLKDRSSLRFAKKLHKLRHCDILIQYHTAEEVTLRSTQITALISEFVSGLLLKDFLERQPGKRLTPFEGLHLLYALVKGMEPIHLAGEYHGDLHWENVIVNRFGLAFKLKLLDLYHWQSPKRESRQDDICDLVRLFYDALGGAKRYSRQPPAVKQICCGLKRSLILKRYPTMFRLREHLETMTW